MVLCINTDSSTVLIIRLVQCKSSQLIIQGLSANGMQSVRLTLENVLNGY